MRIHQKSDRPDQKYDVRLIGNIGNPALSEKKISKKNIKCIRPGYGLDTIHFDKILNKRSKKNINEAVALTWRHISK